MPVGADRPGEQQARRRGDGDRDPGIRSYQLAAAGFAGEFTYVVFGDTQDYHDDGSSNPSFESRVSWVIEQKDQRNIKFVSHLGDVVNDLTSDNELEFAKTQLERLHEAWIPCAFAPGNHDMVWGDTSPITDHLDS